MDAYSSFAVDYSVTGFSLSGDVALKKWKLLTLF